MLVPDLASASCVSQLSPNCLMIWLYRLQQRLSITRREGIAVLTLTVLFFTGLTVRHLRKQQTPPLPADSLAMEAHGASTVAPSADRSHDPSADNPLALNDASRQELQALPGIGPALSERIVEYRTTQRPFQKVRELRRVRGIGPATLSDLRPLVTLTSSTDTSR